MMQHVKGWWWGVGWLGIAGLMPLASAHHPSAEDTSRVDYRAPAPYRVVGTTAFVDVTVVPMDSDRALLHQTVVVEGGRIAVLGAAGQIRIPDDAARVDGSGKVLIPGLADMHAHFLRGVGEVSDSADRVRRKEHQLFLWLAHGLTTVRVLDYGMLAGPAQASEDGLRLRARAAATGEPLMPRLYTSGNLTGRLTEPPEPIEPLRLSDVAEAVRTYKAAGYDFIKVHPMAIRPTGASADVFDSLVIAARHAGLPIVGHTVVPLDRALETYQSIEHLTGYLNTGIAYSYEMNVQDNPVEMVGIDWIFNQAKPVPPPPKIAGTALTARMQELAAATKRAGVWNCPTLYNILDGAQDTTVDRAIGQFVHELQAAGAGLLAGSDRLESPRNIKEMAGAQLRPVERRLEQMYGYAGAIHRELQVLVEQGGLTPYQALATSTRNVAAYFGTLDSAGTIAVGKRADLLLLDGNPLTDIRQTERIAGVMLGGRWLDRAELDRRIDEIGAWVETRCSAATIAAGQTPCPNGLQLP